MKKTIIIGNKEFATKKEALSHFKFILNSYSFGEYLDMQDFEDVIALLKTHPRAIDKIGSGIMNIRIGKVRYNTKSFEVLRTDNSSFFFSYTKRINAPKTDFTKFLEACRSAIQDDLIQVKQTYFDSLSVKGRVKCQESNEMLAWEDLVIDHRQPNTFSVIVDRFIEVREIDISAIKYRKVNGAPDEFWDDEIKEKFRAYHREKANLRIVKRELNLGRSFQAKVKRQSKDLRIDSE